MKNKVLYAIVSLLVLTGCGSMKNMSREDRAGVGAQIGAFVGWLFGGAVGNSIDDDIGGDIGAFVGTAVGGIAGAQIAANTGDEIRVEKRNSGNYTPSSHVLLPDLQIEDILLEEDSVTRDDKINAGETCRISLVIVNNSFQDALDVEPIVKVEKGRLFETVRTCQDSQNRPVMTVSSIMSWCRPPRSCVQVKLVFSVPSERRAWQRHGRGKPLRLKLSVVTNENLI
mgnify:CR=1 FL=1